MAAVVSLILAAAVMNSVRGKARQAPVVSIAHGARVLRVMLVGDSMAGTLGVGLAKAADASGVTLINAATEGCGVAIAWDGGWASSIWVPGPPAYPCQSAPQVTTAWRGLLARYQPDIVVYANRMDTIAQEVVPGSAARMKSILDPSFQTYLTQAMTQAVQALTSTGAHLILTTSAPTKLGLKGSPYDNPERWVIYDSMLRSVAAQSGGRVSVFDLGRFFGGDGPVPIFQLRASSGIQWRCTDGLHFSAAGGVLVAPVLFGMAWQLANHASTMARDRPPVPASVANQPWGPFTAEKTVMGCGA